MSDAPQPEPHILHVPVCEPCLRAEGEMCHTPGCIFVRHRPPAEWPIDDLELFDATVPLRSGALREAADAVDKIERPYVSKAGFKAWLRSLADGLEASRA